MCGLLVQAPHVLTVAAWAGVVIAGIGVGLLAFRLVEPNGFVLGIIGVGIGLFVALIMLGVVAAQAVDRMCGGPAPGVRTFNVTLGYEGQPNAPRLVKVSVSERFVVFDIVYLNTGTTNEDLECPDPSAVNGVPSVEFEALESKSIEPVDYYCKRSVQPVVLKPGQSFATEAKFQSDWRFRRPFTFWWYGATAKLQL
jgi:hypothetical protein